MSRYWIRIDDAMGGPYTVDQLIRVRGFSRQARVSPDEGGQPSQWISPAEIPELAHIFKAVEETNPIMPKAKPKPKPKMPERPQGRVRPVEPDTVAPSERSNPWVMVACIAVLAAACAGGYAVWQSATRDALRRQMVEARRLVENVSLDRPGGPVTFAQVLQRRNIQPRWDVERQPSGVFRVSAIWFESAPGQATLSADHAFEVNLDVQTVRPLNSRAAALLAPAGGAAEGAKPAEPSGAASPAKKKSPPAFDPALSAWQSANQEGDFESVWDAFSERKLREMAKGGISRTGFLRLQQLTRKVEAGMSTTVVKVVDEGPEARLVLIRQSQPGRPDVFVKQYWVVENGAWKLDDEQKRAAEAPASREPTETPGVSAATESQSPPPSRPPVTSLPGISN